MTSATASNPRDPHLFNALARRIAQEWDRINWSLFGSQLRPPVVELSKGHSRLGSWSSRGRVLSISRQAIFERPWSEVIDTLQHEMAHQFVDEILGGEDRPHGPKFRQVCETRGIDPAATAGDANPDAATKAEDKVIARVRKLLALAQSSNQHEAELAAATAQRLMLKFNLELQDRHHPEDASSAHFGHAYLGEPSGRVPAHMRELGGLLTAHFFVRGIWVSVYRPSDGKEGSVLEICGRHENLEMAKFVHHFVLQTVERLWSEHKRAHEIRSNRERRSFLAGAVAGFDAKLRRERSGARSEGLVWVGDSALESFFTRRHPRVQTTRHSVGGGSRKAYFEGHSAGGTIVLSRPVESASSGSRIRALPPGK